MSASDLPPTEAMLDGRYRLGECIGEGGMARVFRAEDVTLGRTVAVKMFRPNVETATTPGRARSETNVLASLNHPSLVTLFDAQLIPGRPEYMVMELIDGPTLSERISEGLVPSDEVAHYAEDLAEALHVVHTAGVVHRDIKPSNILLEPSRLPGGRDRAKLADFGIAWLVDTTRLTTPGVIIGTAAYIAPEQVRGDEPSPAADIYSLGLVLLEALTVEPAFPHAEGIGTALVRLTTAPAIPVSIGPHWSRLITRMTAIDPAQRPTAAEVAEEVSAFSTAAHRAASHPTHLMAPTIAAATADAPRPARTLALPPETLTAEPASLSRRRHVSIAGVLALVAATTAIVASVWVASLEGTPVPVATFGPEVGPAFERVVVPAPSNPTDDTPADETVVVPADTATTSDDTRGEQEKAEQEQRQAEQEAQKQAEKAEKEKAKADKKAEQDAKKE